MQIGPRLELRQTQRLAMTPQLRQAISLLQMPQHDLDRFLQQQLDDNPLLTRDDDVAETPAERVHVGAPIGHNDSSTDINDLPAAPISLAAHVTSQLGMMIAPAHITALAQILVQELEPDGYLRAPLGQIAERYKQPLADLESALALIQACEPSGIGARDLRECMALQLAEQGALSTEVQHILDNLDSLAAGDRAGLMAVSGLDSDGLDGVLACIRRLNPRPGGMVGGLAAAVVVPDVILRRDSFGQWICELNPETQPRMRINHSYAAAVNAAAAESGRKWTEQANWLLRALQQRANSILKVANAIVEHQAQFFEHGVLQMQPLALREIAEKTKLHESTVSRTVNGKYLTCPMGTFELRYFFTAGLNQTGDESQISAVAIRARIKRLIDAENQKKPLSDDDLANILRKDGVDVARRTIAKYREAMGISSSVQRRRNFALHHNAAR